jgi:hypothetical protein
LYGYTGFRTMALAVPTVILIRLAYALRRADAPRRAEIRGALRPLIGHLAAAGGLVLLLLAPLLRYAADRPEHFLLRTISRVTGSEQALGHSAPLQFAINMGNALLMVNARSDSAWFHSPPGRPALETVGGALVVLGALTALWRARRGDWRSAAAVAIVPLLLLSSVMALAFPSENPSLTRASAALPIVVCLGGLAVATLGDQLRRGYGAWGSAGFLVVCAWLAVAMMRGTTQRYFVEYRDQYSRAAPNTNEMAAVIRGFLALGGDRQHAYLVGWPFGADYRAIGQLIGDLEWGGHLWVDPGTESARAAQAQGHPADPARKLYIIGGDNAQANVQILQGLYPNAIVTRHDSPIDGRDFSSVFVPGEARSANR